MHRRRLSFISGAVSASYLWNLLNIYFRSRPRLRKRAALNELRDWLSGFMCFEEILSLSNSVDLSLTLLPNENGAQQIVSRFVDLFSFGERMCELATVFPNEINNLKNGVENREALLSNFPHRVDIQTLLMDWSDQHSVAVRVFLL